MKQLTVIIRESANKSYLGQECKTDLKTLELPSGKKIDISGRIHLGDGVWRIWNSNNVLDVEEVGKVTGFEVTDGKIKTKVIEKDTKKGNK
jgi:hypothetical protein